MKINFWELIKEYNINTLPTFYASTPKEAQQNSKLIGYPVAVKINSPDISHKSDVGGVILNVNNSSVKNITEKLMRDIHDQFPKASLKGVSIQKMAPKNGIECIVGIKRDPQFGHVVMFGLGGIYTEVLKDITFRVTPFEEFEAYNMIEEIKSYAILNGIRGAEPISIKCIVDVIMTLQEIVRKYPEIEEFDINPLMCYSDGCIAIDGRVF